MKMAYSKRCLRILALLAMLLFCGDLVVDAVADMSQGHCTSENSQSSPVPDKAPCSHCACATHSAAVVIADFGMSLGGNLGPAVLLHGDDEAPPSRLAGSIDHPPQLA